MIEKKKSNLIPFGVLFGLSFLFSLETVFSPISNETFGHDAGIFAYIGMALTKGEVLYTGAWDNKGPLLYFINALGILINYRYGIYLLEICTIFTTSVFLYKIGLLFVSRFEALICTFFCMLPLTVTVEGGNLSEEYALPFTTLAFYLIAKFFKNEFVLKKYEMLVVGMCIGAIFMLRLNILAFLAVAVLYVIIALLTKKEYKTLVTVSIVAVIGFLVSLAPFVIYLAKTGSLKMCIDTVYLGILGFFSDISIFERIYNVCDMILSMKLPWTLHFIVVYIVAFPICFLKNKSKRTTLDVLSAMSFFGLFVTLLANSLSGANHMHYFMSFIPNLIIPAIWLINNAKKICDKKYWQKWVLPLSALVLSVVFLTTVYTFIIECRGGIAKTSAENYIKTEEYIMDNSEETDRILVIGKENSVTSYYRTNRLAASNFFYYANGRFSDESKTYFADEISKDVIEVKPKLIMFETEEKMNDFLGHLTNRQEWDSLLDSEYTVQEDDFYHMIYKRNA